MSDTVVRYDLWVVTWEREQEIEYGNMRENDIYACLSVLREMYSNEQMYK